MGGRIGLALALLGVMANHEASAEPIVLDDFEQLSGWTTSASEGGTVQISPEPGLNGMAMRIDFDIPREGGYAIVRKELSLKLPDNYAFTFQLKGDAPRNNVEFKLVDPSGKSVWWRMQRDYAFPPDWQPVTIRKARIKLAWGAPPAPKRVGAIEFAIASGNGGKGTVWIDDLAFEEREPTSEYRRTAKVRASSAIAEHEPERALDDDAATSWKSESSPEDQWLAIDFVRQR